MSVSGKSHINQKALSNIGRELGGFSVAEIAAEGTWLGVAALATMVPEKLMHDVTHAVGKAVVEPFLLDPLEKVMDKVCQIEECKPKPDQSREERAAGMVRAMIIFLPALAASWEVKIRARRLCNNKMGVPHQEVRKLPPGSSFGEKVFHHILPKHWAPDEKMIFMIDEGMQLGSMYVLNNQLAPVSDDMIRATTGIAQKLLGMPEKKAHDFATASVIWAVPNAVGAVGAAAVIAGKHLYDWPKGWLGKVLGRRSGPPLSVP